jgi:hypothetical protein
VAKIEVHIPVSKFSCFAAVALRRGVIISLFFDDSTPEEGGGFPLKETAQREITLV